MSFFAEEDRCVCVDFSVDLFQHLIVILYVFVLMMLQRRKKNQTSKLNEKR